MEPGAPVVTERLVVRALEAGDRARFTELLRDESFMVFSTGALSEAAAQSRFEHLQLLGDRLPFSKRAVTDRSTGELLGYTGADWFFHEGEQRLEYGYRLAPPHRGKGYATEAGQGLLARAAACWSGELFGIVHRDNHPSQTLILQKAIRPAL